MTSSFGPPRPEKRLDFRTAIEILRSHPEKLAKSRTASSFGPPRPEKHLDSRTAIEILKSRPENRPDSRMTSSFAPPRPEKLAKTRMTSAFCPPRPEKLAKSRTATTQSRRSEPLVELAQSALSGRPSYSPTALSSR